MSKTYKVLFANNPILRRKADPIPLVDDAVRILMQDMMRITQEMKGVGLAAPQIGISKRIITIDVRFSKKAGGGVFHMANPEIFWTSEERSWEKEYCFSVPEVGVEVERPTEVKVRYLDIEGRSQEIHATDILARCVQHEIDHLNGIVTLDYLSSLRRQLALKKIQRIERAEARAAAPQ